jgi:uncharacterized repeat protein (TIGR03803 family)
MNLTIDLLSLRRRFLQAALAFTAVLIPICWPQPSRAQSLTVLHQFEGGTDGAEPNGGLIMDKSGNLYGTTSLGGVVNCPQLPNTEIAGCGTVFKISPAGTEKILHRFNGLSDGNYPRAGLVADAKGNLYGTAYWGGFIQSNTPCNYGCGTVFKLDPAFSVLYAFKGPPDGYSPDASVILDSAGNLYGTTVLGGTAEYAEGTVFEVDPSGNETVLHAFQDPPDGSGPLGRLSRDAAGNLYGTTENGGVIGCPVFGYLVDCGTVFRLDPQGNEALYDFPAPGAKGFSPAVGLITDGANFYSTTASGGSLGYGVLFALDSAGHETVVYNFDHPPTGDLAEDGAGNLYGAIGAGGTFGKGSIFKIDTSGNFTVLYSFTGQVDGYYPQGGLVIDAAGNLYGTAWGGTGQSCNGGACGLVFKLTPQ